MPRHLSFRGLPLWALSVLCGLTGLTLAAAVGCQGPIRGRGNDGIKASPALESGVFPFMSDVPTEKSRVTMPSYVIEPPDILLIDAVKLVPKSPYHVGPLDVLLIVVGGTLPDQPINGQFGIDPSGMVDLGPAYGKVHLSGQTSDEARETVDTHLRKILRSPEVSVTVFQTSGLQPINGEHLVGPDGTVNMGTYGTVYVAGMTIPLAKAAIEDQLKDYLEGPQVSVDVFAFNSKVYYVITEGAGSGDTLVRVPITGNETVLDALAQVNGLSRLSSKNIWIARPAPGGVNCDQTLPVNWYEITKGGATASNYQILPGDRIFIAEDKLIALDVFIDKLTNPAERLFGFSLLATQGIQTFNRFPKGFTTGSGT